MNQSIKFIFLFQLLLPNFTLTPGATLPVTKEQICVKGYSKSVRNISSNKKLQVFGEYHIDKRSDKFEIDHLISLELGGSNNLKNLWPQSYTTKPYNAHLKDRLESHLHVLVCNGTISLKEAQDKISINWIKTYDKYFGAIK